MNGADRLVLGFLGFFCLFLLAQVLVLGVTHGQ